mmetsp:Transcript_19951/g.41216  ORF Transcript_19951/g.41216 Transcript_19951/m.41216 type:complete len:441 (-) Transcript_19951:192-1514(-)
MTTALRLLISPIYRRWCCFVAILVGAPLRPVLTLQHSVKPSWRWPVSNLLHRRTISTPPITWTMPPLTRSRIALGGSSAEDNTFILPTETIVDTTPPLPSTPQNGASLKRSKYFSISDGEPTTVAKKGRTATGKGSVSEAIKSTSQQKSPKPKTPTKSKKSPSATKPPKSPKTKSSSPRKREKIEPGSLPPPKDWEKIYSLVQELRADKTAPVDSVGAEALPERHLGEVVYRYQVLIALMLSSQTKDAVVGETMKALQKHGLTVENIQQTDNETLNNLIQKVGFHNNKTKFIKESADILITTYNGDIPQTAEEMMKLPGVGPKMAYIVESIAFQKNSGIGVDTHMHRMFNDLKWMKSTTPEGTREQLEGWLPRERWGEINALWVGFGQEVQQQKEKMLKKALTCSSPLEALAPIKKLRFDVSKEAKRYGLEDDVRKAMGS